jgi:aryl-alcohol dehydrogenase-like predicted oxidoreductase
MLTGFATAEGTARYAARLGSAVDEGHFRMLDRDVRVSSLGLGTYLGPEDATTDVLYQEAVVRALALGINVIDTAVNYRNQRSERAVGTALEEAVRQGLVRRDEVLVATKGGFIPLDAADRRDPRMYFTATYLETGLVVPDDVVAGSHCITPRYLRSQIERSRANLGLDTLDVYYVHNPETQLDAVDGVEFLRRMREAFAALEEAVGEGKIARYGTATWNGYRQDPGTPGALSLEELVAAARDAGGADHHFRVIQAPYNLAMPEAFTRATQRVGTETVSVVEAARRLGLYVMASASVHQGQLARNLPAMIADFLPGLSTDAQRALQFVRSTPGIGTALVGMKTLAHVDENMGVARLAPLPWTDFQRLFREA